MCIRRTNKSHKKLIFHQILYHPWNSLLVINIILCVRSIINKNIYFRWVGTKGKGTTETVHWICSKNCFYDFLLTLFRMVEEAPLWLKWKNDKYLLLSMKKIVKGNRGWKNFIVSFSSTRSVVWEENAWNFHQKFTDPSQQQKLAKCDGNFGSCGNFSLFSKAVKYRRMGRNATQILFEFAL